jgi:ABC-type transport system involved in multi-copper enzyme maturation permease subunit
MVMRYLLALLAILFSFDQVCGERQEGTLQQTLSNPVRRRTLLTAKLFAGLFTLAAIVVMSALIIYVILWVMDISIPAGDLWRTAGIFLAAFLYSACFLGIGTLVSAVVRTSGVSILICLAAWCLLVIVAPGVITQLAEALSPVPPAHQIYQEKLSIERSRRGSEVMVEGTPLDEIRDFNRKKLEKIGAVEEDFHNLVLRQERLAQTLGLISPAVVFESVATGFAGTGIAEEHEMLNQLYRHFAAVAEKDDYEQELARRAQETDPKKKREESEKDELPVFRYRPLAAAALFTATMVQWAALLIVTIALFGLAYLLFNRYDVRTSG